MRIRKDDMIDHVDAQHASSRNQAPGQVEILAARRRIAGRVIVKQNERRRAGNRRLAKHVAWMRQAGIDRPHRNQLRADETMAGVEHHHAEALDRVRAELRQQKPGRVTRRQKSRPRARREQQRPPAKLHRSQDARRERTADAGHLREVLGGETRQSVRPSRSGQQPVGNRERAGAGRPVANHDRQELVVSERNHAGAFELLARSIPNRQILHPLILSKPEGLRPCGHPYGVARGDPRSPAPLADSLAPARSFDLDEGLSKSQEN